MKTQKKGKGDKSTTEKLLNAAERLFAEHGYDGVGMRALADEAGVNLGAATYHYGSKQKLYIETVMRHFRPIGEDRVKLLQQAEKAAKQEPLPVETIVDCMLRPPFLTFLKYPHFQALLARNLFVPPPFMQELLAQEFPLLNEPFVAALTRALPNLPQEVLRMRYMFAGGVILMVSRQLSKMQMCNSPVFCEYVIKEMVAFITAGLRTGATISDIDLSAMALSQPNPTEA